MASFEIDAPPFFRLKPTVVCSGYHEAPPWHWDAARGVLLRTFRLADGRVLALKIGERRGENSARRRVRVEVSGPRGFRMNADRREECESAVRLMLMLDLPLAPFYRLCAGHPVLGDVKRAGGGRILRAPSLFEDAVKAIAWSNTTWSQAVRTIAAMRELGDASPRDPPGREFPLPEQLAEAGENWLREKARLGYRAPYIAELAERAANREAHWTALEADLRRATGPSFADLFKRLKVLRGVGPTTAHYLLTLSGRFEEVAIDSATYSFFMRAHNHCVRPTDAVIRSYYRRFTPFDQLAYWLEMRLSHGPLDD